MRRLTPAAAFKGIEWAGGRKAHELGRVGVKPMGVDERLGLLGGDQPGGAGLLERLAGRDVEDAGTLMGEGELQILSDEFDVDAARP